MGDRDHGLHGWVIGAALLLSAVVLYFMARDYLSRTPAARPSAPAVQDAGRPPASIPGASATLETPAVIPPLLIQRTGRPAPSGSARPGKAPPSPHPSTTQE